MFKPAPKSCNRLPVRSEIKTENVSADHFLLYASTCQGERLRLVDRLLLALRVVRIDLRRLRITRRLTAAEALAALVHDRLPGARGGVAAGRLFPLAPSEVVRKPTPIGQT